MLGLFKVVRRFGGRVRIFVSGRTARHRYCEWFAPPASALGGLRPHGDFACNALNTRFAIAWDPRVCPCQISSSSSLRMASCSFRVRRFFPATGKNPPQLRVFRQRGLVSHRRHRSFDADGFLYITDRKRSCSRPRAQIGGLSPSKQAEEQRSGGASRARRRCHKFISALISPNFVALEGWATNHGISVESRAEW